MLGPAAFGRADDGGPAVCHPSIMAETLEGRTAEQRESYLRDMVSRLLDYLMVSEADLAEFKKQWREWEIDPDMDSCGECCDHD